MSYLVSFCSCVFLVLLALRIPHLGKRELILVLFARLFDLCLFGFVDFVFLLAVREELRLCDCGTPWTFLLPFFSVWPLNDFRFISEFDKAVLISMYFSVPSLITLHLAPLAICIGTTLLFICDSTVHSGDTVFTFCSYTMPTNSSSSLLSPVSYCTVCTLFLRFVYAGLEPGVSIWGCFCRMCMHLENIGFLPVLWSS